MHELVIVLSDLYISQETPAREWPDGVPLPGLQHVARFGSKSRLAGGWRPWVARWLTGHDTPGGPASVAAQIARAARATRASATGSAAAAAAPNAPTASNTRGTANASVVASSDCSTPGAPPGTTTEGAKPRSMVWMATPVHLVTGLTSLHLDRRSLLRLPPDDSSALASEFQRVFHDSGFELRPLGSGDFLLFGPNLPLTDALDPAQALGTSLADIQRAGAADPALRRLGAEVEMWLHDHPLNETRKLRGELPITGLWLWGGGATPDASRDHPSAASISHDIAFGRDAYLQGLWAMRGAKVFPLPQQLTEVFGYPEARRAALVIEISSMLHANPTWTFFDAVAQIDRSFVSPAVDALNRGKFEHLAILANAHELSFRARDRLKVWRRTPPGLSGLQ